MQRRKLQLGSMALALLVATGVGGLRAEAHTCNLTVTMRGFKSNEGVAMVGLWKTPNKWLESEGRMMGMKATIKELKAVTRFAGIPCGKYSVAVFHDANKNGEQDTSLIGIPKEGYGFSGKKDYRFGPLEFEEALIPVNEAETELSIKIHNVM